MPNYIYLHGFASSPKSNKAQYISDRFSQCQIPLQIPDLNQGDFSHLTITRQLQQVGRLLSSLETPVTLIGSSLGGLTAALLAEKYLQIERLVLLAPAFGFISTWLSHLGEEQIQQWQDSGYLSVYHHTELRSLPLHYHFVVDALQYQNTQFQRAVPTLILHGRDDEVIPIQASRDYVTQHPWANLIKLESDHGLVNVMPEIWQAIQEFCQLT